MRKLAALALLLCSVGMVAVSAQKRIFTNPKPDAGLRQLFPKAAVFSPLGGALPHFKAYAADPRTNPGAEPIGFAFWTTDMVPQEHGYHGPIHILVGMDLAGILTGVVVDYDAEPYGYFSVEPTEFATQFAAKSIREPFTVGKDVDAVSRASITITSATRAIRDSSRMFAKEYLAPDAVKR